MTEQSITRTTTAAPVVDHPVPGRRDLSDVIDLTDGHRSEQIVDTITQGLRPIRRVAFSLGSNLGEREENLQSAIDSLLAAPEIYPYGVSPVYETSPVGGPDQPDYLNAVLVVDTTLSAVALLERANAVEEAYGRDRSREERWGPRTLDIDVLVVGDKLVETDALTVPHPRLAERAFVLVPWGDVDPSFEVVGHGQVRDLRDAVSREGVRRRPDVVLVLP